MTMSPAPAAPPDGYWGALRAMPPQALAFVFAAGVVSVSIFGMYLVLLNLYLLRLGYGPEFIGLVQGTGIFAIVALSMPASAAGRRWGLHGLIVGGISAASSGAGRAVSRRSRARIDPLGMDIGLQSRGYVGADASLCQLQSLSDGHIHRKPIALISFH